MTHIPTATHSPVEKLDGTSFTRELADSRWWLYAVGFLLMLAGFAAIAAPFWASLAVEAIVGWMFIIGGVSQLIHAWQTKGWGGFAWETLIGLVFLIGGFTLLTNPVAGLFSLTLVIIATFLTSGVFKIAIGLHLRPMDGWGWFIVLGIISIVVGVMIWNRLPTSAAWSLGLLAGVDFLSAGLVFLRFGHLAGRAERRIGARP
ncbi:MAG: hded protein [Hyphomicrobiales bacterium]|nr:hded protein [Hyphomicrobiales bacterium]